jgi:hypothetical protein
MEDLKIYATVNTGELAFTFANAEFKNGGDYVIHGGPVANDYVSGEVSIAEDGALNIILNNLHPGSYALVKFDMKNIGTIPLKLTDFVFEGENANLDQIVVVADGEPLSLEEYFKTLEGISIDVDGSKTIELLLAVKKCATEENFEEKESFDFTVKGNVRQYNDDGSCEVTPDPEPEDPVKTGLKFVKTYECKGKDQGHNGKQWVEVKGRVYYTFSEGEDEFIENIDTGKIYKGKSWSKNYDGYKLEITYNNNGAISW